jgi:hypothetical protein
MIIDALPYSEQDIAFMDTMRDTGKKIATVFGISLQQLGVTEPATIIESTLTPVITEPTRLLETRKS